MRLAALPKPLDLPGYRDLVDLRLACTQHDTKFVIELSGHGFEASRPLDRNDLLEMKDWIKEQLGEAE